MDHLCYLYFVIFMLLHLFVAALWSFAGGGGGWPLAPFCNVWLCFCHISMYYSGSVVVVDCIDS